MTHCVRNVSVLFDIYCDFDIPVLCSEIFCKCCNNPSVHVEVYCHQSSRLCPVMTPAVRSQTLRLFKGLLQDHGFISRSVWSVKNFHRTSKFKRGGVVRGEQATALPGSDGVIACMYVTAAVLLSSTGWCDRSWPEYK